jgi:hypothetical protein
VNENWPVITSWVSIGGCPRSGTTMLGNILGAAENAIVTPEAQFASELMQGLQTGKIAANVEEIEQFVRTHWRFQIWKFPFPDGPWASADARGPQDLASDLINHLVSAYARERGKPHAEVWIDHTPEHIRSLEILSQSNFDIFSVHLIRDGRAVAASFQTLDWGPTNIISAAHYWIEHIALSVVSQAAFDGPSMSLRYEDIVEDLPIAIKRICQGLPIDFCEQMGGLTSIELPEYTLGQHSKVRGGIDRMSSVAWRSRLSQREIEIIESIAGPLLGRLGYPRQFDGPRSASVRERLWYDYVAQPLKRRQRRTRNLKRRVQGLAARQPA